MNNYQAPLFCYRQIRCLDHDNVLPLYPFPLKLRTLTPLRFLAFQLLNSSIKLVLAASSEYRLYTAAKRASQNNDGKAEAVLFAKMEKKRTLDKDSITILNWWDRRKDWVQGDFLGPFQKTEKLPDQCGGCYFTNDRSQEKTADALLVDETRWLFSRSREFSFYFSFSLRDYWNLIMFSCFNNFINYYGLVILTLVS